MRIPLRLCRVTALLLALTFMSERLVFAMSAPDAASAKQQIAARGVGKGVKVHEADGTVLRGKIVSIGQDSFGMQVGSKPVVDVPFANVREVQGLETLRGESRPAESLPTSEADEAAIRKFVENFDQAWNRHDAVALFGMRASEIDRITAFGGWIRDPAADERVMKHLFAGPFGQSKHKDTVDRIRFLTSDVAIVIIHQVFSVGPTGGSASYRGNPNRGNRMLQVLVKHEGNWQLAGFANVPIIPPPVEIREAEGSDVLYGDPAH